MNKFRSILSAVSFYASLVFFIFLYSIATNFLIAFIAALTGSAVLVVLAQIFAAIFPITPLGNEFCARSIVTMANGLLSVYDGARVAYSRASFFISDLFAKKDTVVHQVEWEVV